MNRQTGKSKTQGDGAWQSNSMGYSWGDERGLTLLRPGRRQSTGPRQTGIASQQRTRRGRH